MAPSRAKLNRWAGFGFSIIEETVLRRLTVGLGFANLLLDRVDPTQRLTHIAIAAVIDASDYKEAELLPLLKDDKYGAIADYVVFVKEPAQP